MSPASRSGSASIWLTRDLNLTGHSPGPGAIAIECKITRIARRSCSQPGSQGSRIQRRQEQEQPVHDEGPEDSVEGTHGAQ